MQRKAYGASQSNRLSQNGHGWVKGSVGGWLSASVETIGGLENGLVGEMARGTKQVLMIG